MEYNKTGSDREDGQIVVGRNAAIELLKGSRTVECVYICEDNPTQGQPLSRIIAMAREKGAPVKKVNVKKLEALAGGLPHQGVIVQAAAFAYSTLDDLFARAQDEPPLFIIADGIEDPHNLGAIIRTAEAAGAHGIILPKHGGVGLTPIVGRTSAGAVEYLPIARVTNLVNTIDELKKRGVWIFGADTQGDRWEKTDLTGPIGLVIGSEGFGISRLVREHCDGMLSLPMRGKVNSLNASVAAGILIFEAVRQRTGK